MNTRQRVVTEEQVHAAMEYLRSSSHTLGDVSKRARYAENWLKHVEALEWKASDGKSSEARKADARTSARYVKAIDEDAAATGELRTIYALREAASAVIEAWRTESATLRSMKI